MNGMHVIAAKADHTIHLQVSNRGARYPSFLPYAQINLEDFASISAKVSHFTKPGDRIVLQWRGVDSPGITADWLGKAIERLELSNQSLHWQHEVHSNLRNYSSEWARLFKAHFHGRVKVIWEPANRYRQGGANCAHMEDDTLGNAPVGRNC